MNRFNKLSINKKIIISVNVVSIILLLLFGAALIKKGETDSEKELMVKIKSNAETLTKASARLIWNEEIEELQIVANDAKKDADVSDVSFFDPESKFITNKVDLKKLKNIRIIKQNIKYEDKVIGKIQIAYNMDRIYNQVKESALFVLICVIIIQIILSIVIFLIVRSITTPLNNIIEKLQNSSGVLQDSSNSLTKSSSDLSTSVNEQASSIEETSASLEELTGMINHNVSTAEDSSNISKEVQLASEQGSSAMNELIESMKEIIKSNEDIQNLVTLIGEIKQKTAVIDEIVFQTKLLSFNASVESERAGEHGRGFAVVAQEVGELAKISGSAALEISTIVQKSINETESITQENKKKVETGNKLVLDTAQKLKDIEDSSKKISSQADKILKASKEQDVGISQINQAIAQLDKNTQGNAIISDDAANNSRDVNKQSEGLSDVVTELNQIVQGAA